MDTTAAVGMPWDHTEEDHLEGVHHVPATIARGSDTWPRTAPLRLPATSAT
jgi:hypothetical protein